MNLETPKVSLDESAFRWELNQDTMATEKLAEGIKKFGEDCIKLENLLRQYSNDDDQNQR